MDARTALAQASMLMITKEYDKAIAVCDAALATDPRAMPVLKMKLALLQGILKRYPEALQLVDYILPLTQGIEHLEMRQMRGFIMANLGNKEEAVNSAKWILHLGGGEPRAYELAAGLYAKVGDQRESVATYDAGIRFFPRALNLYRLRGLYLHTAMHYQDALATYDAGLAFAPQDDELWYNRGCTLARLGHVPAAVDSLRRAIGIRPSSRDSASKDPDYEVIKTDPGFRALVGLP